MVTVLISTQFILTFFHEKGGKEQSSTIYQKKIGTCLGKVMATRNRMAKMGQYSRAPDEATEQCVWQWEGVILAEAEPVL